MKNKLTIITVNRNNAIGLQRTMESVFKQDYKAFEYIVVDGASTDESVKIIQSFNPSALQLYSWISESDNGVYEAMNKGIRMATGEYLLFLNSGDYLVNEKVLENVLSKDHSADFLCGRCNISDKGKVIHTTNPPRTVTFGSLYNGGLAHQSTFIKKELFKKFGFYREDFQYNADIEFWYKSIILGGATTQKTNAIVSDYNLDGISLTQNKSETFLKEHEIILSHPIFQKIVPDYEKWKSERIELAPLYWLKSKRFLYYPFLMLYKIACFLNFKVRNDRR